ncbi:MAG: ParA family protein [Candidatus Methylumidiphilus sp.]
MRRLSRIAEDQPARISVKSLSIANQKGGVGKSTLSVHICYAAIEQGLRVLLVDMDKQGSLTLTFPPQKDATPGLKASALYSPDISGEIPETISPLLSIIRADSALLSIDKAPNDYIRHPARALKRFDQQFDLCIIDTPPLLGLRLMASLAASDCVVTPVPVGLYELAGVADLMQTIQVVKKQGFNPRLRHIGILPMRMNTRSKDEVSALASMRLKYGDAILPDIIVERAPVKTAIAKRMPVWLKTRGDGHLKAAREWKSACNAILERVMK